MPKLTKVIGRCFTPGKRTKRANIYEARKITRGRLKDGYECTIRENLSWKKVRVPASHVKLFDFAYAAPARGGK